MDGEPIRWSGDAVGLEGWQRDLYEYLKQVGPDGVALGNLPASVQTQLDTADADAASSAHSVEGVAMLLVLTQQLAGRTAGVISRAMLVRLSAAVIAERMTTAPPRLLDENDPGAGYAMSFQPSSTKPFLVAGVLRKWKELGFPDDLPDEPARAPYPGGSLTLPELGFFVSSSSSPNGRFRLAWRDGERVETKGRVRWQAGGWVVLDGDRVASSGQLERPNAGDISDTGSAVIADWTTEEGRGDLVLVDEDGQASRLHRYAANLGSIGISPGGQFGAVSTLYALPPDGSSVAVWDLRGRREMFRRQIDRIVGKHAFAFDEARSLLWISPSTTEQIALHLDGSVATDHVEFQDWLMAAASPTAVAAVVRLQIEQWGTPDRKQSEQLLKWLSAAVGRSTEPLEQASLLRWMGEIAEGYGATAKVVEYWRRAVSLNPNVGVRQKLKRIDPEFASSPAGKGQLVAQLNGSLEVAGEWRLDASPSALLYAGGTTFLAGLGQSPKGNILLGDVSSRQTLWRGTLQGKLSDVNSTGVDGWFAVTTEGSVIDGATRIWLVSSQGQTQLLAQINAVTTGPPALGASGLGVGCRNGRLYCVTAAGDIIWTHLVGSPASPSARKLLGVRIGFGASRPQSSSVTSGADDDAPPPSPYHVAAGEGGAAFVYASGAAVAAIDSQGATLWQLGEPGVLNMGNGSLLVDAVSVGPDGSTLIQRRNFRLTMRRPNGEAQPLNPDVESQRQLKAVDWARGRIWARDHTSLVICDLQGARLVERPDADSGWMTPAVLCQDGERLAVWHDSSVDIWNSDLNPVGSARFAGEPIRTVVEAGAAYMVATNKRVVLLREH